MTNLTDINQVRSEALYVDVIVAYDKKYGIAKKETSIPWKFPLDMRYFADMTKRVYAPNTKNALIVGKTTWKLIPEQFRGFMGRITIVVSTTMTQEELQLDNKSNSEVYLAKSFDDALNICQNLKNLGRIFACGGERIYKEAFESGIVRNVFVTFINHDFGCDVFFPYSSWNIDYRMSKDKYRDDTILLQNNFIYDFEQKKQVKVSFRKYIASYDLKTFDQNPYEQEYLDILENLIVKGNIRQTRNGITRSSFGNRLEFDLNNGFPLLTTKKMFMKGIVGELLFFLAGKTNSKDLEQQGIKIWEPNTTKEFHDKCGLNYEDGDMGPMYGFNWIHFGADYQGMNADYTNQGFNQIDYCLHLLKTDPFSRRIIMTTFNPAQASKGVLYPCHGLIVQFYVRQNKPNIFDDESDDELDESPDVSDETFLDCSVEIRSNDWCCGNPFNNASYALLVHIFTHIVNNDVTYKGPKLIPGRLIMNIGDTHIYEQHLENAMLQILRIPYKFPQLKIIRQVTDISDFKIEDFELVDYTFNGPLKFELVA